MDWFASIANSENFVFRAHGEFGFLGAYNEAIGIPPFERFFLGGDGLQNFALDGRDIIGLRGYPNTSITPGYPLNPTGGTGGANMATEGWTAKFVDIATLKNVIATNQTIIGGCLVYGGSSYAYTWTLTAGTGTNTPLVPSTSNYLFSIV